MKMPGIPLAFVLFLVLVLSPSARADQQSNYSVSITIISAILVATLILVCFFIIYVFCCSDNFGNILHIDFPDMEREAARGGLNVSVIQGFPTLTFAELIKDDNKLQERGVLECSICLSEFEDQEMLTLLVPACHHIFHTGCIDAWLKLYHVTCPVCRANLGPQIKYDVKFQVRDGGL